MNFKCRFCLCVVILLLGSIRPIYPSTLSDKIDWLERRTVVVGKITPDELELCKPYFESLLEAGVYKEDVFAIFNYLLREKFDLSQKLETLRELTLLLARRDIASKTLRNFVSGRIKIAEIRGMDREAMAAFLIDEIRLFDPKEKYKSTPYKLINQPKR